MAVAGGICFLAIGGINEILDYETPFLLQMLYGAIAVTATEFIFGCKSELITMLIELGFYQQINHNI